MPSCMPDGGSQPVSAMIPRPSRLLRMRAVMALAMSLSVTACGAKNPDPHPDDAAQILDGANDGTVIDCSIVGCSAPPLCVTGCQAPCGCCPCAIGETREIQGVQRICGDQGCFE
jgi:hypothetical protein